MASSASVAPVGLGGVPSASWPGSAAQRSQRLAASPMSSSSEITVRHAPVKFGRLSDVDRTSVAERIVAFLRSRHPVRTAECVAAETNLKAETIQKILDRVSMPSGVTLIYLVGAYGPEFLAAAMGDRAPQWLTVAGQDAELARLDAEMAALKARREALANR